MIVDWMVYAILTGSALTLAATAADRLAALSRHPRRFVWLTAMFLTTSWPAITLVRHALLSLKDPALPELLPRAGVQVLSVFVISPPKMGLSGPLTMLALVAWGIASALLIARLAFGIAYVRREQRNWRPANLDGVCVLVSAHVGPAVIGIRRMHIVLPEWVFSIDQSSRALILSHETEHRFAGDPYLLLCASLLTALVPWNLPLWYQARRVRSTLELDCDARVLRSHPHWRDYARLLLAITQRESRTARALAPALSESASNLERRITAMRTSSAFSRPRAAVLATGAAAALALACGVNEPQSPDTNPSKAGSASSQKVAQTPTPAPAGASFFEFQVEHQATPRIAPTPRYPAALKGTRKGGDVLAQYVVDENGLVDMTTFTALKSSSPEFTAAVKAVLPMWRFTPASVGGKSVKQLVQQAFEFSGPPSS